MTDKVPGLYDHSERMRTYFKGTKTLTNDGSGGIIEKRVFFTKEDPMREVFGAGTKSHPQEIENILKMCDDKGIKVIRRKGVMSYQPNPTRGAPGQLVIDDDASYSAWKHEERHILDDEETQWSGFRLFTDKEKAIKFEVDAYDVEIQIARTYNRPDMVERLEELKENRRRELLGE